MKSSPSESDDESIRDQKAFDTAFSDYCLLEIPRRLGGGSA